MRLNKWFYLFWTTLLIGALSSLAVGLILQSTDQKFGFIGNSGIGFNIVTMVMGGLMFSVISQMGFFAYLTVNYIAYGIFRNKNIWQIVQIALMAFVLFDLGYLPYLSFKEDKGLLSYFVLPLIVLILSFVVAYLKVKKTNPTAWIPTLFFMSVATVIEAVPALQQNNQASLLFMGIPLFVCNAWQILLLHKLVSKTSNGALKQK